MSGIPWNSGARPRDRRDSRFIGGEIGVGGGSDPAALDKSCSPGSNAGVAGGGAEEGLSGGGSVGFEDGSCSCASEVGGEEGAGVGASLGYPGLEEEGAEISSQAYLR